MNFSSLIRVVSGGVPPYSEGAGGINFGLL